MVGWVKGAGRLGGTDAGPDGGARFKAGPPGASGIAVGGTGGGRAVNIWAAAGAGTSEISPHIRVTASASARKSHLARPSPPIPLPPPGIGMLFTHNAAN